jgi:exonuclease III
LIGFFQTHAPDVVLLTEFRENDNAPALRAGLAAQGLLHFSAASTSPKENTVGIFAKQSFVPSTFPSLPIGDRHRLLSAQFDSFGLYGVYFSQNQAKASLFQFLLDRKYEPSHAAYFVIGDFNTGLYGLDEEGETFFCAEQFAALPTCGLVDSWRSRNPKERVYSWYSSHGNGFRIDHVFASPEADARIHRVYFDHAPRESRATDHSALVVEHDS